MLKEDVAQPQSHSSGTSAPRLQLQAQPPDSCWGQTGCLEKKGEDSDGPQGLPGLLSTNRLPDRGVRPACPSSKPHPSVPSVFPQSFQHRGNPCSHLPSSTVQQVWPHLRDPLHSHTLTNTLAHTDSKTHIPVHYSHYVHPHVCSHMPLLSHIQTGTHTSSPHWHGHTHSPIHTCPILSRACLHIPIHVPTKVCA